LAVLLREWRRARHVSQLELSLGAEISQKHLSFIEAGRARPSREMVLRLAVALDLPLRARNELLDAAGYAPIYPERLLGSSEMARAYAALGRILAHHEPYPAMVLDRSWTIVMRNRAAARIIASCVDTAALSRLAPDGRLNFLRLYFDAHGMRSRVRSWSRTAPSLIARVRREAMAYPGSPSDAWLRDLLSSGTTLAPSVPDLDEVPLEPTVTLELALGPDIVLTLFNTLTTFGTPQDVTLQELRVEMSFPADEQSDALLRRWGAEAGGQEGSSAEDLLWAPDGVVLPR
jgi:transcriptional regulator with XRE-family HTH domain